MIAIDASALICIALKEPEAQRFAHLISEYDCLLGGPTLLEAHLVLRGRGANSPILVLDTIAARPNVQLVSFTQRHSEIAREAFDRFGRGRHPAGLNFGDCMSYAVAKHDGARLLFKGNDFTRTDIMPVENR
ncbi:MAG: type II toxin-antitoxin system VapC family toxin [Methylobacteriaceae bacterium]|nr:type II toxin-antitoxin system VapC family toxin [Methylobacteriaceae bacterium]